MSSEDMTAFWLKDPGTGFLEWVCILGAAHILSSIWRCLLRAYTLPQELDGVTG